MTDLSDAIREGIRARGPIGFDEFMERALYDPEGGYYAGRVRPVGRRGDFFTSVSVGNLFGELLAEQCAEVWDRMGRPVPFDLVEQGAHDGRLAADILEALERRHPALARVVGYRLIEPLERLREAQRRQLEARWGQQIRWAEHLGRCGGFAGIFLCNELVDAFPCRRVRFEGGRWRELRVGVGPGGNFCWVPGGDCAAEIAAESRLLAEGDFPEGYTTEVRPAVAPWMDSLAAALRGGVALIFDYGFSESAFFDPARRDGTLRCHEGHRALDDPFGNVGQRDISAHVNFSRLAREAAARGLKPAGFADQHHFLVGAGRRVLEEREGIADAQFARRFAALAHPGLMGRAFKALGLSRGMDLAREPLSGFTHARPLE